MFRSEASRKAKMVCSLMACGASFMSVNIPAVEDDGSIGAENKAYVMLSAAQDALCLGGVAEAYWSETPGTTIPGTTIPGTDGGPGSFVPGTVIPGTTVWVDDAVEVQQLLDVAQTTSQAAIGGWRAADNDLYRRMGDLRDSTEEEGAWGRIYGGKSVTKDGGTERDVSYRAFQLGYDTSHKLDEGKLFTGLTLSHTKGDMGGGGTDGDLKTTMFGVYASYVRPTGHFVDFIVKYGNMSTDFTRNDGIYRYNGDFSTNGLNMSAEYGYRQELKNNFYLEPQVELNYSHLNGYDYNLNRSDASYSKVNAEAVDSLVGRLGLNFGKKTSNGNVYLKLSYLHEFNGDVAITTTGMGGTVTKATQDMGGSWFEYGIGFNQKIAKNQMLYGEISRTAGGYQTQEPWKGSIGWRISF